MADHAEDVGYTGTMPAGTDETDSKRHSRHIHREGKKL